MSRIIFVTGTDTAVGKTIVTCLLVAYVREQGVDAVALKPFCSGSREDIRRLRAAQQNVLSEEEICPFYFKEPLTPMLAARRVKRRVRLEDAVRFVRQRSRTHACVIVEGAGGFLAPLGEGWSAAEWVRALRAEVIVVAADRLGTINHTLLTVEALRRRGCHRVRVILNEVSRAGDSSRVGNEIILREYLGRTVIGRIPWLGLHPASGQRVGRGQNIFKKVLARLADSFTFTAAL